MLWFAAAFWGLKHGVQRYKFGLIVDLVSGAFHNLALTDADEVNGPEDIAKQVQSVIDCCMQLLTWGWNLRGQLGAESPTTLSM